MNLAIYPPNQGTDRQTDRQTSRKTHVKNLTSFAVCIERHHINVTFKHFTFMSLNKGTELLLVLLFRLHILTSKSIKCESFKALRRMIQLGLNY